MQKTKFSPLLIIFITVFIDLLGFGIVLPLSPYYTKHLGGTAFEVGLLGASYSLMQFVFAPFWGRFSDQFGRRPILLMSNLGNALAFFAFASAETLPMLFVARILQGVFGANISVAQAYMADISSTQDRSKSMGLIGAAFGLGFVFGPVIGAQLSQYGPVVGAALGQHPHGIFGMGFPALVSGFICLLNFTLSIFVLPESLKKENRRKFSENLKESRFVLMKSALKSKANWLIMLFFLATFSMANMEATLALLTEDRLGYGIKETGKLFGFIGIVMAITQGMLIKKTLTRFGEKKILIAGPLIAASALLLTAFITTTPQIMVTMALLAIGSGLSNPAILGAISKVTSAKEQGETLGVTHSFSSLARIIGPSCGGYLFSRLNPIAPYITAGVVMFFAAFIAFKNRDQLPHES